MKTFIGLAILASALLVSAQEATTPALITPAHPAEVTTAHPGEVTTAHPAEVTTAHPAPTTQHVETVTSRYHSKYSNPSCNFTACVEPSCQCLNDKPPRGLFAENVPQFVTITFDGAVTVTNFPFFKDLFTHKNPNGCPIQATYFVSHVDTNYKLVHELYRRGNEIASHSISKAKNNVQDYWKTLQLSEWKAEMGGQRRIISKLADIPIDEIRGARAPNLQTAGNVTIAALVSEKFEYDCSSPSRKALDTPFFPYTFDYGGQRGQDCPVQPCVADDQVFPGFWEVPMNDLKSSYVNDKNATIERECASAAACILFNPDGSFIPSPTADQIYNLFMSNFNRFYNGNRAPFPLYLNEDWIKAPGRLEGLIKFIEEISKTHKDVFFVSLNEVINWMKTGGAVAEYTAHSKCKEIQQTKCALHELDNLDLQFNKHCQYTAVGELDGQDKTMVICDDLECPVHYPWTHREL